MGIKPQRQFCCLPFGKAGPHIHIPRGLQCALQRFGKAVEQHHQSMLGDGHHGITLGREIDIGDHQGTLRWGDMSGARVAFDPVHKALAIKKLP